MVDEAQRAGPSSQRPALVPPQRQEGVSGELPGLDRRGDRPRATIVELSRQMMVPSGTIAFLE